MFASAADYEARFTLLGELSDKTAEASFQLKHLDATRTRMRFVCILTALAYLISGYADTLQISGTSLQLMLAVRLVAVLIGFIPIIHTFRKVITPRALGWTTGAYMTAIITGEIFEVIIKADVATYEGMPITVLVVLLFYLFLPPQIWQAVIAAGVGSLVYLAALLLYTDAPGGYVTNTILIFLLTNGFGLYFCIRFGAAQRREFMALSELRHQAETDALTGIYNRRMVMELGGREFSSAKRYGHPCSMLMLDIDHFKIINDTYGHAAGDGVLTGLAARCKQTLREVDLFGRVGGEEFAIIMPHCSNEQAYAAAERIRQLVADKPFTISGKDMHITVSIGVASVTERIPTLDRLFHTADQMLYQAKQDGRNRVCCHE